MRKGPERRAHVTQIIACLAAAPICEPVRHPKCGRPVQTWRKLMENQADDAFKDEYLRAAKREEQARARAAVRSGKVTQETMLFIAPSVVRGARFRRRTAEF